MESNKINHWIKILRYFEKAGFIHYGLTIPFLVGIYKNDYTGDKENLLKDFLDVLKKSVDMKHVKISYCSYLEEDVVSTINLELPEWLYQSSRMEEENIAEYMKRYDTIIKDDLYSKIANEWHQFTKLDIQRIKEANENVA